MNVVLQPPPDRLRLLGLMGIDVYVTRSRVAPPPAQAPPPAALPEPARQRPAAVRESAPQVAVGPPLLLFATGEQHGFDGPFGPLLRQLAQALGVDAAQVSCAAPRGDLPCVCFGTAPGQAEDAILAPPLATLRASATARRSLWPALRPLARRLRR
jgi:hypothetical protein